MVFSAAFWTKKLISFGAFPYALCNLTFTNKLLVKGQNKNKKTCCMLLDVVACCCAKFETGQTVRPVKTDAILFAYNSQHCWELLRPFGPSLKTINLRKLKQFCGQKGIVKNRPY